MIKKGKIVEIWVNAPDYALWEALQNGEKTALAALFNRFYDVLFAYGHKLTGGDATLTKELIQDVFYKIWTRHSGLSDVRSPKAYLLGALKNTFLDKIRASKTLNMRFDSLDSLDDADLSIDSPEDLYLSAEQNATQTNKIQKLLNQLPNRVRQALELRFFQELDYPDVAEIMHLKERAVYNLVHEGLTRLRQSVKTLLFTVIMLS